MPDAAFYLSRPAKLMTSVVFASPHSGTDYTDSFLKQSVLNRKTIRSSEDAFVDLLFDSATLFGAPFLKAAAPRAYVDLNRSADELDPALLEDVKRAGVNPRVASGLGVIPRVVANGRAIYRGKLPLDEAHHRIERYWRPYHAALHQLLSDAHHLFGEAILIDCHSMPTEALDGVTRQNGTRPQIVLGDRFGAAASARVVDQIERAFADAGFDVARNSPFAGAYIAQTYGRPSRNQHTVQIEIDRSIYMDESRVRPNANFDSFRDALRGVIGRIAMIGREDLPLAAE